MQLWMFQTGRVALLSCSARKAAHPCAAQDLYQGQLFQLSREWVQLCNYAYPEWGILSAQHGLLMPGDVIAPYDLRLVQVDRQEWSARVSEQIRARWGTQVIYTLLAGAEYHSALQGFPYVEDKFGAWRDLYQRQHPRRKWGLGKIKQRLIQDNARLRAAWAELDAEFEGNSEVTS